MQAFSPEDYAYIDQLTKYSCIQYRLYNVLNESQNVLWVPGLVFVSHSTRVFLLAERATTIASFPFGEGSCQVSFIGKGKGVNKVRLVQLEADQTSCYVYRSADGVQSPGCTLHTLPYFPPLSPRPPINNITLL